MTDTFRLESIGSDGLDVVVDRCLSYEIVSDLTAPSEARFELGNEGTWSVLREAIAIGTRFLVVVNERPWMRGRLLARRLPVSSQTGATVQLTIRTVLADAMYTTADPTINLRKASLRDMVLAAYAQLGLAEPDFIFNADLARNLVTGKGKSTKAPADLAKIKEDAAKPSPPEPVYNFVERHLNRFHLTHWDGPDGRIVVGAPNDEQAPIYNLRCLRNARAQRNNVMTMERGEDFEEVPTRLTVAGVGGGREHRKAKVRFDVTDPVLTAAVPALDRSVVIVDDGLKNAAQVESRARREMAMRSLAKNAWRVGVDGWSYRDGHTKTTYAVDTVADVQVDIAPEASGAFLVYRVALKGSASDGHTSDLDVVGKGVWRL